MIIALSASTPSASGAAGIRPQVKSFLDAVAASDITGIKHTTRGLPRKQTFEPQAPRPFAAGRFQVTFQDASGTERAMIFQTEGKVGHLHPVTPGTTKIDGHISILSDPADSQSETLRLNPKEQDAFLAAAYQRFEKPMTSQQAEAAQSVIDYTAAIRFSGQGADAASRRHAELAG